MNDIVTYDVEKEKIIENMQFSENSCRSRIYHCGFKIGKFIFTTGGMGLNGKLLEDFIEIDLDHKRA